MMSPLDYLVLYNNVQSKEVEKYIVKTREIKFAIKSMVEVYKPDPRLWNEKIVEVANYDDPAYRCAYLYKYAPLHTCLVQDMFIRALNESAAAINPSFWSSNDCLNICSLGGGPGIDTIGVLSALHKKYGLLRCSAQIIESMSGWSDTFDTILKEFRNNHYRLSGNLTPEYFQSSYIVADLLGRMDSAVNKAIGSANLITMVKFLSAATCIDTAQMIRKIFNSMRHGAVVFIIDNASGGYSELVSQIAGECRMVPVFGPLQYVQYSNATFNVRKYGSRSCFSTQVTVHLLMKPYASPLAEWNFSPKPIMDYKWKTDYGSSSEDDSAVSFETSGYDSDYSKVDSKSFLPFNYQRQDLLNFPNNLGCDSRNPKSFAIHQRQDKLNFVHNMGYESSNFKSSVIHKRQDKFNVVHNVDYDSSNSKSFVLHQRQDKFIVAYNIDDNSSYQKFSTSSGSNFHQSDKFVFEDDRSTAISPSHLKSYDNLETAPCYKHSNGEPDLDLISSLAGKSNSALTKRKVFDSRLNYPLYELFPQNNEKNVKDFKTATIGESEGENDKKHVASIFQMNLDKMLFREKTETDEQRVSGNDLLVKATPHNTENILKENTTVELECSNCSRLKRIKWLQKMCNFCNR